VITYEEAERRGQRYDGNGMTYLLDLDYHDNEAQFVIDAGIYGNASHFINHSVSFSNFSLMPSTHLLHTHPFNSPFSGTTRVSPPATQPTESKH